LGHHAVTIIPIASHLLHVCVKSFQENNHILVNEIYAFLFFIVLVFETISKGWAGKRNDIDNQQQADGTHTKRGIPARSDGCSWCGQVSDQMTVCLPTLCGDL
jgi:hypothetical protein